MLENLFESKTFKLVDNLLNPRHVTKENEATPNLLIVQLGAHDLAHGLLWDKTYLYLDKLVKHIGVGISK